MTYQVKEVTIRLLSTHSMHIVIRWDGSSSASQIQSILHTVPQVFRLKMLAHRYYQGHRKKCKHSRQRNLHGHWRKGLWTPKPRMRKYTRVDPPPRRPAEYFGMESGDSTCDIKSLCLLSLTMVQWHTVRLDSTPKEPILHQHQRFRGSPSGLHVVYATIFLSK